MIALGRTDTGKVRPSNQDALLETTGPYAVFAVADGMGGHRGGNVASAMAVDCLSEIDTRQCPDEEKLKAAFDRANRLIWERQRRDMSLSGMGTTLTALWEGDDHVLLGHVGDSRAYLFRDGTLRQVSDDHSLVGELLALGEITADKYDALVLPGGTINPDHLRREQAALEFIRDFWTQDKVVAAICHAPWLLAETGIVRGRHVTSFASIRTDVINAGGIWEDSDVVVDQGLVTSRKPSDLESFCLQVAEEIAEGRHHRRAA